MVDRPAEVHGTLKDDHPEPPVSRTEKDGKNLFVLMNEYYFPFQLLPIHKTCNQQQVLVLWNRNRMPKSRDLVAQVYFQI